MQLSAVNGRNAHAPDAAGVPFIVLSLDLAYRRTFARLGPELASLAAATTKELRIQDAQTLGSGLARRTEELEFSASGIKHWPSSLRPSPCFT